MTRRRPRGDEQIWRSRILFTVGLIGFAYEVIWDRFDRPSVLLLIAAMVGLPAFFRDPPGGGDDGKPPEA